MNFAPELARIPAGEFLMGAADGGDDQRPVHRVYVSEFFIGRFPVTNDQYSRFIRATGHRPPDVRELPVVACGAREPAFRQLSAAYVWEGPNPPLGRGGHPVVLITCEDAVAYCAWLSAATDRSVRLPTEAEWEKAARGGVEGRKYPWGNDLEATRGNFLLDPAVKHDRGTRATGTYAPNPFGLYDVVGNVWEWVSDWYAADYYGSGEVRDPQGPVAGTMRTVRGGSWVNSDGAMLQCAYRHQVPADTYAYSIGFRIVCAP